MVVKARRQKFGKTPKNHVIFEIWPFFGYKSVKMGYLTALKLLDFANFEAQYLLFDLKTIMKFLYVAKGRRCLDTLIKKK